MGLSFLYFFLPIFMAVYLVLPKFLKGKAILLAGAALVLWADPFGLPAMAACIFSGYLFGIFIHNFREKPLSKIFLALEIIINATVFLLFHKTAYDAADVAGLFAKTDLLGNVVLLGASVMPLHSIAYCMDIYRRKYVPEHHFSTVAGYIAFFPTFAAGPILSFDKVRSEISEPSPNTDKLSRGIKWLMIGMFTKLFFSNSMFEMWNDVRNIPIKSMSILNAWLGIFAFAFFFFFELNAYSNIARGLALMLGIDIPYNFRELSSAKSFGDIIRKFNTSLNRWCMNYIYRSFRHRKKNVFLGFLALTFSVLVGVLWYGISMRSMVFAAVLLFMLMAEKLFEKPMKKLPKPVCKLVFFIILLVTLPLFAFSEFSYSVKYISAMLGLGKTRAAFDASTEYLVGTYFLFIVIALLLLSGLFTYLLKKKIFNNEYLQTILQPVLVIALLIVCTAFLVSVSDMQILYMF